MKPQLEKQQILTALARLSDILQAHETQGEICLYGGAVMVLAFDARKSTRDVDAVFRPAATIREAALEIGEALGLPDAWLNDGVKGFVSPEGDFSAEGMPSFSHLRIVRPTEAYLLAMKCLAARVSGYDTQGDRADVEFLIDRLRLASVEEVFAIVGRYYPIGRIEAKTKYFIQEIWQAREPLG